MMNLETMKIFFLGSIFGMLDLFLFQMSMGFFDDDLNKIKESIKNRRKKRKK